MFFGIVRRGFLNFFCTMPLDADLGTIELKTSEKTETVALKVMKINDFDDDQKKKLDTEFAQSEVWKSLKSKLDAIKSDVNKTIEWKKNDMVTLLKDFFDVWDDNDEQIKRFVVDWKSYLRINDGEHNFDIELSDSLMPSLVDRFLATSEAQINEWVSKEEEKIKVKYENKTEEAIKEAKKELATLDSEVKAGQATNTGWDDEWFREMFSFKKIQQYWAKWWDIIKSKVQWIIDWVSGFVKAIPETIGSIKTAFTGWWVLASVTSLFKKKDKDESAV